MDNIETIMNSQITVSSIVSVMSKIMMVLLWILSAVTVRQTTLMDRVVRLPVGTNVKMFIWSYFVLMTVLTAIVILA